MPIIPTIRGGQRMYVGAIVPEKPLQVIDLSDLLDADSISKAAKGYSKSTAEDIAKIDALPVDTGVWFANQKSLQQQQQALKTQGEVLIRKYVDNAISIEEGIQNFLNSDDYKNWQNLKLQLFQLEAKQQEAKAFLEDVKNDHKEYEKRVRDNNMGQQYVIDDYGSRAYIDPNTRKITFGIIPEGEEYNNTWYLTHNDMLNFETWQSHYDVIKHDTPQLLHIPSVEIPGTLKKELNDMINLVSTVKYNDVAMYVTEDGKLDYTRLKGQEITPQQALAILKETDITLETNYPGLKYVAEVAYNYLTPNAKRELWQNYYRYEDYRKISEEKMKYMPFDDFMKAYITEYAMIKLKRDITIDPEAEGSGDRGDDEDQDLVKLNWWSVTGKTNYTNNDAWKLEIWDHVNKIIQNTYFPVGTDLDPQQFQKALLLAQQDAMKKLELTNITDLNSIEAQAFIKDNLEKVFGEKFKESSSKAIDNIQIEKNLYVRKDRSKAEAAALFAARTAIGLMAPDPSLFYYYELKTDLTDEEKEIIQSRNLPKTLKPEEYNFRYVESPKNLTNLIQAFMPYQLIVQATSVPPDLLRLDNAYMKASIGNEPVNIMGINFNMPDVDALILHVDRLYRNIPSTYGEITEEDATTHSASVRVLVTEDELKSVHEQFINAIDQEISKAEQQKADQTDPQKALAADYRYKYLETLRKEYDGLNDFLKAFAEELVNEQVVFRNFPTLEANDINAIVSKGKEDGKDLWALNIILRKDGVLQSALILERDIKYNIDQFNRSSSWTLDVFTVPTDTTTNK